jgi:glycosidase
MQLLTHHRNLGQLRKTETALTLGDLEFFQAGDQKLGFSRSYQGRKLKIYVNRSGDPWEIPAGKVLYGYNLRTVAPQWLVLGAMGFCITEG